MKQRKSIGTIAKERAQAALDDVVAKAAAEPALEFIPEPDEFEPPVTTLELDNLDAELSKKSRPVIRKKVVTKPQVVAEPKDESQLSLEPPRIEPEPVELPAALDETSTFLAEKLTMGKGFDTIITRTFRINPEEEHEEILAFLKLSEKPSQAEYGLMANALEHAQIISTKAISLAANANLALARFNAEADVIAGTIHNQTLAYVEKQLHAGTRTKKPTVDDLDALKKTLYHDEWRRLEEKRASAKYMVQFLEGLTRITSERGKDLRQLVASTRNT